MTDRKLFRPNVHQYRKPRDFQTDKVVRDSDAYRDTSIAAPSTPSSQAPGSSRHRQVPPEQTNAENFYYVKQMNQKTLVVVILNDGEEIHGWIEWYDKTCIKVHTHSEQNYLIYKHSIKYITKERQG
jgi:host factor-I protein